MTNSPPLAPTNAHLDAEIARYRRYLICERHNPKFLEADVAHYARFVYADEGKRRAQAALFQWDSARVKERDRAD